MNSFDEIWRYIQTNLKPEMKIKNWTVLKGNLKDTMTIKRVNDHSVQVDPPKAKNLQVVPKEDFEIVWEVWSDYKSQKVKRYEIRNMTWKSKYIISILHWYEQLHE